MVIVAPLEPLQPAVVEGQRERIPVAVEEGVPPLALPPEGKTIRVVLADDHPILRKGLFDVLDEQPGIDIVGEASDGEEVIDLARRTRPDVVVMDVTMPKLSGVEATRRIVAEQPQIRVIGLSMHEQSDMAAAMREAGAAAYLSKSHPTDALVAMILQPTGAATDEV
jgi:DNA-binding NarL/FixJ family response regulator